jgi:aspartyl-tRNA(Asn)/glutamyl-tRNA(Gln) amidotransferase subunit A
MHYGQDKKEPSRMEYKEVSRDEVCAFGVRELRQLYRMRKLSPVEVTEATLERIMRLNPELRAFITVCENSALAAAHAAEQQLAAGIDLGPLHGVPVAVKDIIRVRGTRTTAASRVLLDAPLDEADAPVVQRLRAAGAVLVGKLNMHEFAFGDPDPDSPFGNVQNPRKLGHQAGSSSSGSAAAVAAGLAVASLGTDTGGSVRHPASVCGVVGLKPTYGLVPLRGVIPLSTALDHVGPLGRSVGDVAATLTAIAGHDAADPTSILAPVPDYLASLERDVRGLRLGLPTNQFYRFGRSEALAVMECGRRALLDLGLAPVDVELPRAEETNGLSRLIIDVDLWTYHEQFGDRETLYGRDFLERARPGLETRAVAYAKAKHDQADIRRRWLALFEQVDLLLLPGNVAEAPLVGQTTIAVNGQAYPVPMVTSRYNRAANVTGFPALAVPVGATPGALPIALQLVGPPLAEPRLLAVAYSLEQALGNLPAQWGIEPRRS